MKKSFSGLIKQTFEELNLNWDKILAASVATYLIVFAFIFFFPPFGFFISFAVGSFLCVGLSSYNLAIINKEKPKLESIFLAKKHFVPFLFIFLVRSIQIIFWSMFLFVPGIIRGLQLLFVPYILAEKPNTDAYSAFEKSKELTEGNKFNLFLLILLFSLLTIICLSFSFSFLLFLNIFFIIPQTAIIVCSLMLFLILFAIVVLPFAQVALAKIYLILKGDVDRVEFE